MAVPFDEILHEIWNLRIKRFSEIMENINKIIKLHSVQSYIPIIPNRIQTNNQSICLQSFSELYDYNNA